MTLYLVIMHVKYFYDCQKMYWLDDLQRLFVDFLVSFFVGVLSFSFFLMHMYRSDRLYLDQCKHS